MKKQINFRASNMTAQQLSALAAVTGLTVSEVISTAIDRMYQEETMNTSLYDQALARMNTMHFTAEQMDFIFADWPEGDEHYRWLLTATRKEIVEWINAAK